MTVAAPTPIIVRLYEPITLLFPKGDRHAVIARHSPVPQLHNL